MSAAEVMKSHHIVRCSVISISEDRREQWGQCTGCDFESEPVPLVGVNWETLQRDIYVHHVLDVLRAAGYAVVELPKPLGWGMWPCVMGGETEVVAVPSGGLDGEPIGVSGIGGLSISEARYLAAALLAAADAAEVGLAAAAAEEENKQ